MSVGTIWCVGRNYAAHAEELGNELPQEPLIFMKSGHCISKGMTVTLPKGSEDVHHEVEMALLLDDDLQISQAGVALDLTERQWQKEAKEKGLPWTKAKSFSGSCPLGALKRVQSPEELNSLKIELRVNGEIRQSGNTQNMIFSPQQILDFLKAHYPIRPGDLILTGTPEGVSRLSEGDVLEARLADFSICKWTVKNA